MHRLDHVMSLWSSLTRLPIRTCSPRQRRVRAACVRIAATNLPASGRAPVLQPAVSKILTWVFLFFCTISPRELARLSALLQPLSLSAHRRVLPSSRWPMPLLQNILVSSLTYTAPGCTQPQKNTSAAMIPRQFTTINCSANHSSPKTQNSCSLDPKASQARQTIHKEHTTSSDAALQTGPCQSLELVSPPLSWWFAS
jgi:hypothetical protein